MLSQRRDRELFLTSLRVLTQYTEGAMPSRRDLSMLRGKAEPEEAGLPVDELCCALIRRELEAGEREAAHTVA